MTGTLIVDAHQDLAWNMLANQRDYTLPVAETRRLEALEPPQVLEHEGPALIGWPEYQAGRVAIVFGTLFVLPLRKKTNWGNITYADAQQAHRLYRQQLDTYHELADRHPDKFRLVLTQAGLAEVIRHWENDAPQGHPVGLVPLMEGADGIRNPDELAEWWQRGLRIIGLAWAGTRYSGGTREPGPLTDEGRLLLRAMADFNFTLDISHMDELSARQALDLYPGPVIASHANAAALIPEYAHNRHLSDELIRALVARDGVIGLVPACRFLDYGWKRGDRRELVPLDMLVAQVDHICQIAGDARHVGYGSDFDGGFGLDDVPAEFESIADLVKLGPKLAAKGYNDADVAAVLGENWLRHLHDHLPA
jgi:membrane dipeptidase